MATHMVIESHADLAARLLRHGWKHDTCCTHGGNWYEDAVLALYPAHWPMPATRNSRAVYWTEDISYAAHRPISSRRNKLGRAAVHALAWAKTHRPPKHDWATELARQLAERSAHRRKLRADRRAEHAWNSHPRTVQLLAHRAAERTAAETFAARLKNDLSDARQKHSGVALQLHEARGEIASLRTALTTATADQTRLRWELDQRQFAAVEGWPVAPEPMHIQAGQISAGSVIRYRTRGTQEVRTGAVAHRMVPSGFDAPFRQGYYETTTRARVAVEDVLAVLVGAVGLPLAPDQREVVHASA